MRMARAILGSGRFFFLGGGMGVMIMEIEGAERKEKD